jgi:hypothetical protein
MAEAVTFSYTAPLAAASMPSAKEKHCSQLNINMINAF